MDERIIEIYRSIKKLIQKFNKNDYFNSYIDCIFLNFFVPDKGETYIKISNNIYGKYRGIEMFFNKRGYNFLHDELSYSQEFIRYDECDGINLLLLDSDDVAYNEGKYIHKLGMKIKKNDNVIIYRNNFGKKANFANYNELNKLYSNLDFIYQLISNESKELEENYKNCKIPVSFVDVAQSLYTLNFSYLRKLEWLPKCEPVNLDFVKEYQNKIYNPKESYLLSSYYPMVLKEDGTKPLMISFLSPDDKIEFKYITGNVSTYKKVFFGMLDEIFSDLKYLPSKIYFDNRDLFQICHKTLEALNIEHELIRNIAPFDALAYVEEDKDNNDIDYKKEMNLDSNNQPKEVIETFLNFIVTTISSFTYDDLNLDLDDYEDEIEEDISDNDNNDTNLVN